MDDKLKKEVIEEESNHSEKKLSPLLTDCYKVIQLKNGMKLECSILDAKQLGLWICPEKKHHKCKCMKMKKYGKVELVSESFMKPKSKSIVFD